jgi:predicted SnoaL-like aldol condensation-catalyzing enzyme
MKKLVLLLFVFTTFLIYLVSCNEMASKSEINSTEQKNLAADSIVGDAFRTGDISKIDSVVAADFVDHTQDGDKNRDSLKTVIKMVHDSFPDMKMDLMHQSAKDDYVYTWLRFTGNSTGQMGMPKGPYDWRMMEVTKFKDGKAVEHWEFMDSRDVAKEREQMMKMMQQPGNKM